MTEKEEPPSGAANGSPSGKPPLPRPSIATAGSRASSRASGTSNSGSFDFLQSLQQANQAAMAPGETQLQKSLEGLDFVGDPQTASTAAAAPRAPRERGVSWDARVVDNSSTIASSANATPQKAAAPPLPQRIELEKQHAQQRVKLQDVQHADVELEAETYILESMDEQQQQQQQLKDAAIATKIPEEPPVLLAPIPQSVSHGFRQSSNATEVSRLSTQYAATGATSTSNAAVAPVIVAPKPSTTSETSTGMAIPAQTKKNKDAPAPPTSSAPPLPTTSSEREVSEPRDSQIVPPNDSDPVPVTSSSTRTAAASGLKKNPSIKAQAPKKRQEHNRRMTLEENIFGLASALTAIDEADRLSQDPSLSLQMESENEGDQEILPAASVDRLAHTVNILFNRRRTRTEDTTGSRFSNKNHNDGSSSSASDLSDSQDGSTDINPTRKEGDKWGFVKDNLIYYKKTDEDRDAAIDQDEDRRGSAIDVEQGHIATSTGHRTSTIRAENTNTKSEKRRKSSRKQKEKKKGNPFAYLPYGFAIKEEWDLVNEFLQPRTSFLYLYTKYVVLYMIVPLLSSSVILFYLVGNPMLGSEPNEGDRDERSSISYLLLFLVRNLITVSLAKGAEVFFVDFLCLNTRLFLSLLGSVLTLLVASSKGWPFLLCSWSVITSAMMVGKHTFARHWLFYQDTLSIFTDENPSGNLTSNPIWTSVLIVSAGVGASVSIKRLVLGLYMGRKTYGNHAANLAKLMDRMLIISEVAILGRDIEKRAWAESYEERKFLGTNLGVAKHESARVVPAFSSDDLQALVSKTDKEDLNKDDASKATQGWNRGGGTGFQKIIENEGKLGPMDKCRVVELLGAWEDPKISNLAKSSHIPVSAVFDFRRALARMETYFPFSRSFGRAETRVSCVASAQDVFLRLLLKTPTSEGILPFETIASLAVNKDGDLNEDKVKKMIRVFRPERDGGLSLLNFARSVDKVYKELRMLRATIDNDSKIDRSVENIINALFYTLMFVVGSYALGFDPLALFLSLSTVIVSFAFVIGRASANYVEGLLMILVQRPYGIGDRVNISNAQSDSSWSGAQSWIVEDVSLFKTSFILGGTNERATISNGALANARIINHARSPKAVLFFNLKFALNVPYKKIELFKSAVIKFVQARPREWISLLGMRATRVEADHGYVEYIVLLQHREKWQQIGSVLSSKAVVQQFCLELQKKMNMRYVSPPLPVNIAMQAGATGSGNTDVATLFPATEQQGIGILSTDSTPARPASLGSESVPAPEAEDVSASIFALFEGK